MGLVLCGSAQCGAEQNRLASTTEGKPTPQVIVNEEDDDNNYTDSSLNTLRTYNILLDGYLRTSPLYGTLCDKLHVITLLIKTYYYPPYVITPITSTLQSQNASEFQELFDLSYNLTRADMIYANNTQWHFKAANGTHFISQQGLTHFTKINYHKHRIRGSLDIISSGICNTHSFITTTHDTNDNYYTQNIYYSQLLKPSAEYKSAFYPLINLAFVKDNDPIIDIKCGYEYCLFLTKNGIVWSRGTNQFGQIGKHKGIVNIPTMTKIGYNTKGRIPKIVDIECGYDNNLMIDDELNLWIFGNTSHGQLGIEMYNHSNVIYTAICHPYFKWNNCMIKHISCGVRHSLCIDSNGVCYLFGRNGFGEIGNNKTETMQFTPYIFQQSDVKYNNAFVVDGKCGEMHTVLLTEANDVITFGRNTNGECSTLFHGQEAITIGHVLQRREEMGISEDEHIHSIIASRTCTLIIVDMIKTRMMQIAKQISAKHEA